MTIKDLISETYRQYFLSVFLMLFFSASFISCKTTGSSGLSKGKASKGHDNVKAQEMELRSKLIEYAETFKGCKYKYAGRNCTSGFDCSGFTSTMLANFEITASPASRVQATEGKSVPLSEVQPGDLVFFSRYGKNGKITHVAMVKENTSDGIIVIHSTTTNGVMEDNISKSKYWKPKICFARNIISKD